MLNPPSKLSGDINITIQSKNINEQNNNYLNEKNCNQKHENLDHNSPIKQRGRTLSDLRRNFQLGDVIDFVHNGLESIIDDDVTKRFTTEELTVWNLLSRTNQQYEYVSFRVTVLWLIGFIVRYCFLFPAR
jgi:glycerol-3-phosphate O-acyltransferase 3/4